VSGGPTFGRVRTQRGVALFGGDPGELEADEAERSILGGRCGIEKSGEGGDSTGERREGLGGARREG